MKFIHIADIHANRERKMETLKIIDTLIKTVEEEDIEAVLFCGDFWDSTITNTEASGFSEILEAMKKLIDETEVIMIYGTPSHEPDGSLDVFKDFGATVVPYKYNCTAIVPEDEYLLFCLPEPRLTKIPGNSLEEKVKNYHESIAMTLEKTNDYKNSDERKVIVMYHGDIAGAKLQNDMDVPDEGFALSKKELEAFGADYIACGHIHKPQMVMDNCYYSGSACPKDFGETHDAIFKIVEL